MRLFELQNSIIFFLSLIIAFILTYIIIPTLLRMAKFKNLFDKIDYRKVHTQSIPRIGGIAVFSGALISFLLFVNFSEYKSGGAVIAALFILFLVGIKDDILVISPLTKLSGQIVAATIIVVFGNGGITNFQGVFGIYQLPVLIGYVFSILVYIATINAINFIDGIDGLAASMGIISSIAFGVCFFLFNKDVYTVLSLSVIGSLFAFLRFNIFSKKNKIFLGDTGSMFIGFIVAYLAIIFCETNIELKQTSDYFMYPAPAFAIGVLIIPYFDMIRVVLIRLISKKRIYTPDNLHLHHIFLSFGLSHKVITLIYSLTSIILILIFYFFAQFTSVLRLFLIELLIVLLLSFIPEFLFKRRH